MATVIESALNPKGGFQKSRSVRDKVVVGPDGKRYVSGGISGDSPTLAQDLGYVFARNVARARREAKKADAKD